MAPNTLFQPFPFPRSRSISVAFRSAVYTSCSTFVFATFLVLLQSRVALRSASKDSSLATVLENMPLTYNTETRTLDKTPSLPTNHSDDLAFRRGHIRRSSYESANIQLNFARRTANSQTNGNVFDKRKSVNITHHSDPNLPNTTSVDFGESSSYLKEQCACSNKDTLSEKTVLCQSSRFFDFPRRLFFRKKDEKSGVVIGVKDVFHTTGLILEDRPSNLPAKSQGDASRHRKLHMQLINQTKKKEEQAKKGKREAEQRQKKSEHLAAVACQTWSTQILPRWSEMCGTQRCRELWWQGIPSKVRGLVWSIVIGNQLNITEDEYKSTRAEALSRLENNTSSIQKKENDEDTFSDIYLDVSRTFPSLGIFQKGGPYYSHLLTLLSTYACYRPSVGYVQSMSFLAAVLLLQMEPFSAFVAFSNLLNRPLQAAFFGLDQREISIYFIAYDRYLEQQLPDLYYHFNEINLRADLYLLEWLFTMFAKALPLDITCRIWDVYFRDGEELLFNAALGVLSRFETKLLNMGFDESFELLTRLPEPILATDLFCSIETTMRSTTSTSSRTNKCFAEIKQEVRQKLGPDGLVSDLSSRLSSIKMSRSLSGFLQDFVGSQ